MHIHAMAVTHYTLIVMNSLHNDALECLTWLACAMFWDKSVIKKEKKSLLLDVQWLCLLYIIKQSSFQPPEGICCTIFYARGRRVLWITNHTAEIEFVRCINQQSDYNFIVMMVVRNNRERNWEKINSNVNASLGSHSWNFTTMLLPFLKSKFKSLIFLCNELFASKCDFLPNCFCFCIISWQHS